MIERQMERLSPSEKSATVIDCRYKDKRPCQIIRNFSGVA